MLSLQFHPEVAKDIKSSYRWYQQQSEGLGEDFLDELEISYRAIMEFPETWPSFQKGCKRYLLSKFPFSVLYRAKNGAVYVVAVMHNGRRPGYWHSRI